MTLFIVSFLLGLSAGWVITTLIYLYNSSRSFKIILPILTILGLVALIVAVFLLRVYLHLPTFQLQQAVFSAQV